LIKKDTTEVIPVREDFVLLGQMRAAGIDEIDTGKMVLLGNLLRTQVFFYRNRVIASTFNGRVVCNDDALATGDSTDTGDDAGRRYRAIVEFVGR